MDKEQALELFSEKAKVAVSDKTAEEIKRKVADVLEAFKELNLAVLDEEELKEGISEEIERAIEAMWESDNEIGTIMNICTITSLLIFKWTFVAKGDFVRAGLFKAVIDMFL